MEQACGLAVLASVLLIRACQQAMRPGTSWRSAQLQQALRVRLITHHVEHHVKTRLTKARQVASSLALDQRDVVFE